jgi:hypothetical protein
LELDVFCALFNDDRFLTEWRVILYWEEEHLFLITGGFWLMLKL